MTDSEIILRLENGWLTREELSSMLGLSDRATRAYIEELNKTLRPYGKCVLSSASRKGYHIPNPCNEEDIAIANAVVNELKSKAISIFERRQSVEDFLKSAESARSTESTIQLTLF